jgi:hypothetical protein
MGKHRQGQDSEDMRRDREMLADPAGHGSSPDPGGHEATDARKAQEPQPTPGEEHLAPVDDAS